jgi:hypothetical protein
MYDNSSALLLLALIVALPVILGSVLVINALIIKLRKITNKLVVKK